MQKPYPCNHHFQFKRISFRTRAEISARLTGLKFQPGLKFAMQLSPPLNDLLKDVAILVLATGTDVFREDSLLKHCGSHVYVYGRKLHPTFCFVNK